MKVISFFSNTAILIFLFITITIGLLEKKNVISLFFNGVVEGEKIVIELFPTLLALIIAVGMLNQSGVIHLISNMISPIFNFFRIEKALTPLILLRPISASTTTAIATTLMKQYGTDSKIGLIASCIMGSTETTIYVASLYSSKIKINKIKEVIVIGLIADMIGIVLSCVAYELGLMKI